MIKSRCSLTCGGKLKAKRHAVEFKHLLTTDMLETRINVQFAYVGIEVTSNDKWQIDGHGVHQDILKELIVNNSGFRGLAGLEVRGDN